MIGHICASSISSHRAPCPWAPTSSRCCCSRRCCSCLLCAASAAGRRSCFEDLLLMLEAVALTKDFGTHRALDALDLRVEAGEIVCLLGANGAGKTTTINLF